MKNWELIEGGGIAALKTDGGGGGHTKREATASPRPDAAPDTTAMWCDRDMRELTRWASVIACQRHLKLGGVGRGGEAVMRVTVPLLAQQSTSRSCLHHVHVHWMWMCDDNREMMWQPQPCFIR